MKKIYFIEPVLIIFILLSACSAKVNNQNLIEKKTEPMNLNKLTEKESFVIINKGTEAPFTGAYDNFFETGVYVCKQCDSPLYNSSDKFDGHCGWPAFYDQIPGAVKRVPDKDGRRIEIVCNNCGGHLGHVFEGENFTKKNTRHCVNSISMKFIPAKSNAKIETESRAIFASGCFWGTQYHFEKQKGVISSSVGYIGGTKENPSYEEVCDKKTGHAEAVEVIFDPKIVSYETLAKLYFETHDFTQINRQGPDVGEQYRSEIFYFDDYQKQIADSLIDILTKKRYKVATKLTKVTKFWKAEDYHQNYYKRKGSTPYCHFYQKKF